MVFWITFSIFIYMFQQFISSILLFTNIDFLIYFYNFNFCWTSVNHWSTFFEIGKKHLNNADNHSSIHLSVFQYPKRKLFLETVFLLVLLGYNHFGSKLTYLLLKLLIIFKISSNFFNCLTERNSLWFPYDSIKIIRKL